MLKGRVIDLSSDGWGVVKEDTGRITFVPGAWPGDLINFEIVSEGKFLLGKLHSWIEKSPAHRESPCKHWGIDNKSCRACEWIHINYSDQCAAKEKKLSDILNKFSLKPEKRHDTITGDEFHYRNRVKLSCDGENIGFQIPLSNKIVPIDSCLVAEDWINEEIKKLNPKISEKETWIQRSNNEDFAQGNTKLNLAMKKSLASLLKDTKKTLELFCGDGNFTEVLLDKSCEVYAYESSKTSISKLQNKFPAVKAHTLNLYSKNSIHVLSKNLGTQRIFLDPPRSGFKDLSSLTEKLPKLEEIIYLSCNPMSFARDVSQLKGWQFNALFSFDLFPQTPHLEVMGKWTRSA